MKHDDCLTCRLLDADTMDKLRQEVARQLDNEALSLTQAERERRSGNARKAAWAMWRKRKETA